MKSIKKTIFYYRIIMPILWAGIFSIWIVLYFVPAFVETPFSTALTPFLIIFIWLAYKILKILKYKRTLEMYYIQKFYHKKRNKILAMYLKFLIGWYEFEKVVDGINNYRSLEDIIGNYVKLNKQNEYSILKDHDKNKIQQSFKTSKRIYNLCLVLNWMFIIIPFLYLIFTLIVFGLFSPLDDSLTKTNKAYNYIMHWIIPSIMLALFVVKKMLTKYILKKYYTLYIYSVYNQNNIKHLLPLWRIKNNEFTLWAKNIKINTLSKTLVGEVYIFNKKIIL